MSDFAGAAIIAGTLDTKGAELRYIRDLIAAQGLPTRLVDLSTTRNGHQGGDVAAQTIAACHPEGAQAVFTGDRGSAVAAMAAAFSEWAARNQDIGGIVSAGGSGGTALVTPAMQRLPVATPKVMISTVACGDVRSYVGGSDVTMMYSVTDVQGVNRISSKVLANGAHALAGMIKFPIPEPAAAERPALGMTMFGVTTPAVQAVSAALSETYECLVFHATGAGGRSMEKLVDSGMLAGVVDLTTTEVCDHLMGGVFSAGEDRFGAMIRKPLPYVASVGALDMVNFGAPDTVPEKYKGRLFYEHNPQVTLMRTTLEENVAMGRWIGERLNRMTGPVRFLLPEGGVSALDAPGKPFEDVEARKALYAALEETVTQTADRRIVRAPHHINDPAFADAVLRAFADIAA